MGSFLSTPDTIWSDATITIYDHYKIIDQVNGQFTFPPNYGHKYMKENVPVCVKQRIDGVVELFDLSNQKWCIDLQDPEIRICPYRTVFQDHLYCVRLRKNINDCNLDIFITPFKKTIRIVNNSSDIFSSITQQQTAYLLAKTYNQYHSHNLRVFNNKGKIIDFLTIYENYLYNIDQNIIDDHDISYNAHDGIFTIS